ncbi:MAG: hypothetical protein ACXW1M_06810 [Acidimicrobiia bacterium]
MSAEGPADPEYGDALPEDLDVTAYVGPYTFPDIRRRRIAATLYLIIAAGALLGWFLSGNAGLLAAAILVGLIGAYNFAAGWHLAVDQTEALAVASRAVGFPVGHASAQLAWRGLLSRPAWRMLLYSADDPPSLRGLVELDAVDGHVMGEYTERNPEDWSKYGVSESAGQGP